MKLAWTVLALWFALLPMAAVRAATPVHLPPSLLKALWSGAPEGFETVLYESHWEWRERLHELRPKPVVVARAVIRVPAGWTYKSASGRAVQVLGVKKVAGPSGANDWEVTTEQEVLAGSATFLFSGEAGAGAGTGANAAARSHAAPGPLTLNLRYASRYPEVFTRETCPGHEVQLKPQVENARFLYLVTGCSVFGDDVILYFGHSPDGHWADPSGLKALKTSEPSLPGAPGRVSAIRVRDLELEYRFPNAAKAPFGRENDFSLAVKDAKGEKTEWTVSVDSNSQE